MRSTQRSRWPSSVWSQAWIHFHKTWMSQLIRSWVTWSSHWKLSRSCTMKRSTGNLELVTALGNSLMTRKIKRRVRVSSTLTRSGMLKRVKYNLKRRCLVTSAANFLLIRSRKLLSKAPKPRCRQRMLTRITNKRSRQWIKSHYSSRQSTVLYCWRFNNQKKLVLTSSKIAWRKWCDTLQLWAARFQSLRNRFKSKRTSCRVKLICACLSIVTRRQMTTLMSIATSFKFIRHLSTCKSTNKSWRLGRYSRMQTLMRATMTECLSLMTPLKRLERLSTS